MEYLKYLIEFVVLFLICFLYYRPIAFRGLKKKNNKSKNKEMPEVRLFITLFKIDMKKVNYMKLAKQLSLIMSFVLAITVVVTLEFSENIFLKIVVCFFVLAILTFISYKLLGFYYKKKGLIEDVQSQKN